jgi:predicted  nucleic acid-binding Zn-ribbon protein
MSAPKSVRRSGRAAAKPCRGEVELREEIKRLMGLQILDRKLKELEQSLSTVALRVNQLRDQTTKFETELEKLSTEEQEATAARKKLERELAEGEARLRNKRMRQNLIRNDKELQALSHEVDSLKENNQRLEGELLVMMEGAGPRLTKIKELSETLAQSRTELAAAEKEIAGQVEEIKAELLKQQSERDHIIKEIEPALLSRYDVIFARRGGVAVAVARQGTCQGCMRRLPPQLYNEIQKHLQIHFCPACQRILFYEEPPATK